MVGMVMVMKAVVGLRVGAADVVGWGEVKEEVGEMAGVGLGKAGGAGLPQEQRRYLVLPATDIMHNHKICTRYQALLHKQSSAHHLAMFSAQMHRNADCTDQVHVANTNFASKAMSMIIKGKHLRMQS